MASIGAWVGNDMGYIQFALVAPGGAAGWTVGGIADSGINVANGGVNVGLKMAKMIKLALTLDIAGFDTIIGGGSVTGTIGKAVLGNTAPSSMDMQWVFAQMQGDLGDMSAGLYGDWAHAKGKANGNILGAQDSINLVGAGSALASYNSLNSGDKFDAFSLRATLEPVSQVTLGLGYGYRKTTSNVPANNIKHQVVSLGVAYSIYQNMIVSVNYTNDKLTQSNNPSFNTKTTILDYVIYL